MPRALATQKMGREGKPPCRRAARETAIGAARSMDQAANLHNAQFARAPAKRDNLHRALNVEPDRLADVLCWRERHDVGKQLTLSYDRKGIMLEENHVTGGLVGKYVDTYPEPNKSRSSRIAHTLKKQSYPDAKTEPGFFFPVRRDI